MNASATKTVLLFPGQGSQEKGMGRDLAEAFEPAMELWLMAEKRSGMPLRGIFWDGEASAMAETQNLQPAMTAVNLGLWFYLAKRLSPAGAAGHSLGEYAALGAAGALEPADILDLTVLRGRLMAESGGGDGRMAAVLKLAREAVEDIAATAAASSGQTLVVANYNSPGQFVLSGHALAMDAALALVKDRKGRAVPLAVSGAFHSPMMDGAAKTLVKAMERLRFKDPAFPVYMNVTGAPARDARTAAEGLARQMTSQVRWIETLANMWDDGARTFLELGPKGVLTRLVGPNLDDRGQPYEAANIAGLQAAQGYGG